MSRIVRNGNRDWLFRPAFDPSWMKKEAEEAAFETVHLPHINRALPFNGFDETVNQFVSVYRKHLIPDPAWHGRRVRIRFEGVMAAAEVRLNGLPVASHMGGYTPFEADITEALRFGEDNVLAVKVDSRELPGVPPFGGQLDYLTYGGIYRDVTLLVTEPVYIENAQILAEELLSDSPRIRARVFLKNTLGRKETAHVRVEIADSETVVACGEGAVSLSADGETAMSELELSLSCRPELWELDRPKRYQASVLLEAGGCTDRFTVQTGFRDARFTEKGFFLNGRPVKIRGLNRHQAYPYVGYAMPERMQKKDADILKEELGIHLVRTSHYPQSPHFLDRCDEIGLMVFEELPGWQHVGDEAWKTAAEDSLREMIQRDWNHPAIVMWGVRINESQDFHDFYVRTNRIAHELDPVRQTGGVRAIDHSEFLEDVYTGNDFVYSGANTILRDQKEVTGLDHDVPYLVTEFCGHMYPTKRFDQEERLIEHARRHAAVHDMAARQENSCGAVAWCAFDYNTHSQFGSGDKMAYHGVMDAFRLPKYAAYFYMSQMPPEKKGVLQAATVACIGERSGGGVSPLTVYTNYDYVTIYSGDQKLGTYYPRTDLYPGLDHPPIVADQGLEFLWGEHWKGLRIEAYWNGSLAETQDFTPSPHTERLTAQADDACLFADGSDTTRVVFRLEDQNGHLLPFNREVLELALSGPARLIGPEVQPLPGGCAAVWVRAGTVPGRVMLTARAGGLEARSVELEILPLEGEDSR